MDTYDESLSVETQDIHSILDTELGNIAGIPWNKLEKINKLHALYTYAKDLQETHNLLPNEVNELQVFMKKHLDRRKFNRRNDVVYDVDEMKIKDIPMLIFIQKKRKFTLKKIGEGVLKSLAPRKTKRKHSETTNKQNPQNTIEDTEK